MAATRWPTVSLRRDFSITLPEWATSLCVPATLAIRAQINLWDEYHQTRTAYADRATRPVAYVETRNIDPRTFYSLRLRKSF